MEIGSIVEAKLIEVIEKNRWIVSFQGQLIQVKNNTDLSFKLGKRLFLKVVKQHPLELQVLSSFKKNQSSINLSA